MTTLKELIKPLEEKLDSLNSEALELRFGVELPSSNAAPNEIVATMYAIRPRLDRLESILVESIRLKRDISQLANSFIAKHEESWDAFVSKQKNSSVTKGVDFTGPRERYAEANLATLESKRDAMRASSLIDSCESSVTAIRYMHSGLKDLKEDMRVAVRAASFQSSLEM